MNNCPKCGSSVNPQEVFCKFCGTKLDGSISNFNNQNQNFQQNNEINDNYLIDSYIGKHVYDLRNGGFSLNALLFGCSYLLYRKMWLLAFVLFVVEGIFSLFFGSVGSIINIIINVIFAIKFKDLYLKHVRGEINKIKANNPGASQEQLTNICKTKGGTTMFPVIILVLFYMIVAAFSYTITSDTQASNVVSQSNMSTNVHTVF